MSIQIEFWQLVTLLLAFFGFVAAAAKVLFDQIEKRIGERFTALNTSLDKHLEEERKNGAAIQDLERDFLKWQADLPVHYVRREDYVRGQSVIEAKLDAVFSELKLVQIKGAKNG